MQQNMRAFLGRCLPPGILDQAESDAAAPGLQPFNLLRWFSILSFLAVTVISIGFAATLSHFLTREILQRDAMLSSQFVASIVATHNRQARLGRGVTLTQVLDKRADLVRLSVDPSEASYVRDEFFEHIRLLPDVLLANVYAPDRKVIWATNPSRVGQFDEDNAELEKTFKTRELVATNFFDQERRAEEKQRDKAAFTTDPQRFFVESYIPLLNADGEVLAVVEIYKETENLLDAVKRCRQLVWTCTALGMVFLYFTMFWIVRRADMTLEDQQRRLLEAETLCVVGEMSASVAHGIRNPLAAIRSSAELALDGDPESMRQNANDIIAQVDRLGKWVRELLVFSRPVAGEAEAMDILALVYECLPNFTAQLEKNRIRLALARPNVPVPPVRGNRHLVAQALSSVISNAIEAMPGGGFLQLELQVTDGGRQVALNVTDTGAGLSETQVDLVFKPFYTTKRNGLGLGMALARRIMQRFGGSIHLHSEEGTGTCVSLTFTTD